MHLTRTPTLLHDLIKQFLLGFTRLLLVLGCGRLNAEVLLRLVHIEKRAVLEVLR